MTFVSETAVDAYHALLDPSLAREMHEFIETESVGRRLLFNDRPFCRSLRPNFLSRDGYLDLQQAAQLVGRSLAAVYRQALEDEELRRALGTDPIQEQMISIEGGGVPGVVGRLDGLVSAEGEIRFIEYNTVPFGIFLMDGLGEMYADSPAMRRFGETTRFQSLSTVAELLDSMSAAYGHRESARPLNLVCIGAMPGPTMNEFRLFVECMERCGHKVLVVPPEESWTWRGESAWVRGVKAELVLMFPPVARALVNEYGASHPFLRAVSAGSTRVFNGLGRTSFFNSKMTFAALSDPEFQSLHADGVPDELAQRIPWTRRVRRGSTTYAGESIELMPFLERHRDRFVLKPARSFGGTGVVLGWRCTPAEWSGALSAAREQEFVVQERVAMSSSRYPGYTNGSLNFDDLYSDLNVYVWQDDRAQGCMVRLSADPILNLTAGHATAVPTFLVDK